MDIAPFFNILSILFVLRGLRVGYILWQQWPALKQGGSLSAEQQGLIEQASFFLTVPIGVFFHELCHALLVWAFGGRVVEFGYRFFWGYVQPDRAFAPEQEWAIAIAGTAGSLLFGVLVWLLLRGRPAFLAHLGYHSLRYQLTFSLIMYPVMTLFTALGDWRIIYDFQATPLLSGLTVVLHAGLLGLLWWLNRCGWFESGLAAAGNSQPEEMAAVSSLDEKQQLAQIKALEEAGALNQATHQLKAYLRRYPESGQGHLLMAFLESQQARPPASMVEHAEKALSLGLADGAQEALAYHLLGQYRLHRERVEEAIHYFSQGLAAVKGANAPLREAQLRYARAIAYRRQRRYEAAYEDIEQAIQLAETPEGEQVRERYQIERETIERHAGRPLGPAPASA
jgi:hypothetical protein